MPRRIGHQPLTAHPRRPAVQGELAVRIVRGHRDPLHHAHQRQAPARGDPERPAPERAGGDVGQLVLEGGEGERRVVEVHAGEPGLRELRAPRADPALLLLGRAEHHHPHRGRWSAEEPTQLCEPELDVAPEPLHLLGGLLAGEEDVRVLGLGPSAEGGAHRRVGAAEAEADRVRLQRGDAQSEHDKRPEHAAPVPGVCGTGSRKDRGGAGPERHRPEDRLQPEPEERGGHPQRLVVERAREHPEEEVEGEHLRPEHHRPHRPRHRGEEEQDIQRDGAGAGGERGAAERARRRGEEPRGQHQQRKEGSLGERVAPGAEHGAEHRGEEGNRGRRPEDEGRAADGPGRRCSGPGRPDARHAGPRNPAQILRGGGAGPASEERAEGGDGEAQLEPGELEQREGAPRANLRQPPRSPGPILRVV